ncbi:hypothetical protein ACSBR2_000632 [Camellia fascicularis]
MSTLSFADLVIEFDLKVTLLKSLRHIFYTLIYIYTRMYTITHVDEVKCEPSGNP